MAKRFTDSDKWKKRFFRILNANYKLLWLYMWDDCDHAGIWHVDIDLVRFRTGLDITEELAIEQFGESIKILDGGDKWFMPGFVEFQYGLTLDPAVKAQRSVLKILQQYNLHEDYLFGKELPF